MTGIGVGVGVGLPGRRPGGGGPPPGPPLAALGVTFDGLTTIHLGSTPSSVQSAGLCAFWFNRAGNGSFHLTGSHNATTEVFEIIGDDNTDTVTLALRSAAAELFRVDWDAGGSFSAGDWHPYIFSWDTNFAAGSKVAACSIDGVAAGENSRSDANDAFTVDWLNATDFYVGGSGTGSDTCHGDFSEFYLDVRSPGSYVSAVDPIIMARYISAGVHPADIGSNGSVLNGFIPKIYQSVRTAGAASDFLVNRGSRADFTVAAGALSLSGTNP